MSLFPRPSQNCLERQTLTNLPPGPHAGVWPQPRRQREKLREETENPCHNAPLPAGAESLPPSCKPEMSWAGVSGDQAGMSEAHSPGGTAGEVRDPEKQQQGGRGQVSRQARRGDRGAAGQRAGVAHTAAGGGGPSRHCQITPSLHKSGNVDSDVHSECGHFEAAEWANVLPVSSRKGSQP